MLFDFASLSEPERYKLMVATVVPRPIAWVTSLDPEGRLNAAPFSFFNVMGGEPPILVIGIGGRAPGDAKDTGNNIRRTGQFVVNLVSAATAEAMVVTAIEFGPEVDELAEAGLTATASTHVRPPRIAESPVAFECERFAMMDFAADRSLVIGRVLAAHIRDDCVLDAARCYIDTPKLDLVGRMHGGGWYARTRDRFELPRIPVAGWERRRPD
ncbi:MAG TPA: flavin reductase family protein [Acetobacteraceae bacterium]|jgi:flavin reductase (DIM6/NTAB) family NADH-FMN oxidoreductase RutF|nr:flavin reductase family protein [Acetobacteraceae bacterium]